MKDVLEVENLSKLYKLGEVGTGTISHDVNRWWAKIRGKEDPFSQVGVTNNRSSKEKADYVWALKDVNFKVKEGEVLGIIGRNGAGKSTLLKLISQITSPSSGSIKYKGRIASLLEVGTGMHPEMTARENIYLNGAILGMRKSEIQAKFDDIVDFSGCALYVDTPLKRFSSGMRVRLGFAVAAFLEPEILIVDEVLAVGDAEFQQRAIGKMKDISKGEGRTVLFVSHNMASVKSFCKRGILMENGKVAMDAGINEVISGYLSTGALRSTSDKVVEVTDSSGVHLMNISSVKLSSEGKEFNEISVDDKVEILIDYEVLTDTDKRIDFNLRFKVDDGVHLLTTSTSSLLKTDLSSKGKKQIVLTLPTNYLNEGSYLIDFRVVEGDKSFLYSELDFLSFKLNPKAVNLGQWMGKSSVYITAHDFDWKVK